jgi:hypothetical protein
VLLSGFGVAICARIFRDIDVARAILDLRRVGPRGLVLVLAPAVGNFVHALGWRSLLDKPWRPPVLQAFRIFVAAQAGNEVGSGVLGESMKLIAIPRDGRSTATRAVLWDNLTSLLALGCVLLTLTANRFVSGGNWGKPRTLIVALLLLGIGASLTYLSSRWVKRERPPLGKLVFAFAAHYVGKCWIVAEYSMALALVARASWHSSTVLASASIFGSTVGAPIPGQLGAVEGALVAVSAVAGVSVSTILSIAVLRRLRSLIWVLLGAYFALVEQRLAVRVREHRGTSRLEARPYENAGVT